MSEFETIGGRDQSIQSKKFYMLHHSLSTGRCVSRMSLTHSRTHMHTHTRTEHTHTDTHTSSHSQAVTPTQAPSSLPPHRSPPPCYWLVSHADSGKHSHFILLPCWRLYKVYEVGSIQELCVLFNFALLCVYQ